jgi:hypothetical protein
MYHTWGDEKHLQNITKDRSSAVGTDREKMLK